MWLISMDGRDSLLEPAALEIKAAWPTKQVGINYLTLPAVEAIRRNVAAGLDMTWADNARVNTTEDDALGLPIAAELRKYPGHAFFGGVAFKYQAAEPNPGLAAQRAVEFGMIPTTSGEATGKAADVEKLKLMRAALGEAPLAIASGITPDNVNLYAPYLTHILVATGVSASFHDFDYELLALLMGRLEMGRAA
ncbi:hypothetical protein APY03_0697 [Variovorax sp. WDL1]|nr:hypothetical protein APY03_0697 [Variovorax sp. WDL1]